MIDDIQEFGQLRRGSTDQVEAALRAAYDLGLKTGRAELLAGLRLGFESVEGRFVGLLEDMDSACDAPAIMRIDIEARMLSEIEEDPHFAVFMAAEFRRIAALTDGIELPDLD